MYVMHDIATSLQLAVVLASTLLTTLASPSLETLASVRAGASMSQCVWIGGSPHAMLHTLVPMISSSL